jgi:hypothetical protein
LGGCSYGSLEFRGRKSGREYRRIVRRSMDSGNVRSNRVDLNGGLYVAAYRPIFDEGLASVFSAHSAIHTL